MKTRVLAFAGLLAIVGGCYFTAPSALQGEASVTLTPPPALVATPAATLQPATTQPIRVQFALGSYGTQITGTQSTDYLLWAAAGQVFTATLTSEQSATASLYSADGKPLYEQMAAGNTAAATLTASGDHALKIMASGVFTLEVTIK